MFTLKAIKHALLMSALSSMLGNAFAADPAQAEWPTVTGDVKVGLVVPETGPLATVVGDSLKAGTEVIVNMWNEAHPDRAIKLTICNDEGNAERAITCVNSLKDKVDVMIGPNFGSTHAATKELLGIKQIDVVHTPHALPAPTTGIFQVAVPTEDAMGEAIRYMKSHNIKKFGFMTSTDATGLSAREHGLKAAQALSVPVVDVQFDPGAQNLIPQVAKLAGQGVDALFIWSTGPQVVTALRAIAAARMDVPVFLNYSSMSYDLMNLVKDVTPKELLFTGDDAFDTSGIKDQKRVAMIEEFNKRYEAKRGLPPDWMAYAYGDTFTVAMTAALHGADRGAMVKYLENGPDISGFHAVWRYSPQDHIGVTKGAETPVRIQRWNGKRWVNAE